MKKVLFTLLATVAVATTFANDALSNTSTTSTPAPTAHICESAGPLLAATEDKNWTRLASLLEENKDLALQEPLFLVGVFIEGFFGNAIEEIEFFSVVQREVIACLPQDVVSLAQNCAQVESKIRELDSEHRYNLRFSPKLAAQKSYRDQLLSEKATLRAEFDDKYTSLQEVLTQSH